jgi:hypothetical protein
MAYNTSRMNRLEELGRVDAERAHTRSGARNLRDEKRRIISGLRGGGIAKKGKGIALKKGGHVQSMGKANRGGGIAIK